MSIQTKLIAGMISMSLVLIAVVLFSIRWSFEQGLVDYVSERRLEAKSALKQRLVTFYQKNGDWSQISQPGVWPRLLEEAARQTSLSHAITGDRPMPPPLGPSRRPPHAVGRADGQDNPPPRPDDANLMRQGAPSLLDQNKHPVAGRYGDDYLITPIEMDGKTIGWLAAPPQKHLTEPVDIAFRSNQSMMLVLIASVVALLSILVSIPLARNFLRPVRSLAVATHALASGNYEVDLDKGRQDELGSLADDFHSLAATLKSNEQQRKRWLADISHELRTPLSVVKGEIEAMQDGIRPLNQAQLRSLQQEVRHLETLVQDLFELSRAELGAINYHKHQLDIVELIEFALDRHRTAFAQREIELEFVPDVDELAITGDETRLNQVMDNLLGNATKYVNNSAKLVVGVEMISCEDANGDRAAHITFDDSGPGVGDTALPNLFDHLYREEASRNRATGGAGIGLAMCKKIIEAHNGTIEARHSVLGGLKIDILLPLDGGLKA